MTGLPRQFLECLSRMKGNFHVRFLEGKGGVIPLTYSTVRVSYLAVHWIVGCVLR